MNNSSSQDPSLDELLQQVKANYQQQKSHSPLSEEVKSLANTPESDDPFAQIKSDFQTKKQQKKQTVEQGLTEEIKSQIRQKLSAQQADNRSHNLLDDFKNQYRSQQKSQKVNLQQNQEEIRYAEQQRQQRKKLLTRKAEQWLKNLDITSDEGFWFEEFAASYPSKLEAAIDYIAALENPS